MKKNYLKIIFVIDESGSMQGTESDVIGGFNNFIEKQKAKPHGKVDVTLYKFNSDSSRVFNDLPLDKIRPLDRGDYSPGGLTALYDTIGIAITETERHSARLNPEDRPDMVLMVIITDGQENSSREYSGDMVKRLIEGNERSEVWQFIYLGADLSNFSDADTLGIRHRASSRKSNLKEKFNVVSDHAIFFRSADLQEDRNAMMSHFMDDLADDEEDADDDDWTPVK